MLEVLADRATSANGRRRCGSSTSRAQGERMVADAEEARERMRSAGIELTTLDRWDDPERFEKLHELNELTAKDMPHTQPILPQTFEDFMVRVESPSTPAGPVVDRPRRRPAAVAMSFLRFPPVRGLVWTGYTCTRSRLSRPRPRPRGQAADAGPGGRARRPHGAHRQRLRERADASHQRGPGYTTIAGFVSFVKRLPRRG